MKKKTLRSYLSTFGLAIAAFVFCLIYKEHGMSRTLQNQLIPICAYIVMALSLNLVVGFSGELSLGHAGFMSIGAFTGAVISGWLIEGFGLQSNLLCQIIAIVVGGVIAGIAGALIGIPVLRLRGDYLAIVTLAFGEIIKSIITVIYVSRDGTSLVFRFINAGKVKAERGVDFIFGALGAPKTEMIATFGMAFALVIFTLIVIQNLVHSHAGRAIMATRDNRIAAESVGISITKYKMMAFVTAAVLAGMAGALWGMSQSTFKPEKFDYNLSINILVFVVLGGIGNLPGAMISATILTILPEKLRAFSDYRMLAYAIVLILVMLATNNDRIKNFFKGITGRKSKGKTGKAEGGKQA